MPGVDSVNEPVRVYIDWCFIHHFHLIIESASRFGSFWISLPIFFFEGILFASVTISSISNLNYIGWVSLMQTGRICFLTSCVIPLTISEYLPFEKQ